MVKDDLSSMILPISWGASDDPLAQVIAKKDFDMRLQAAKDELIKYLRKGYVAVASGTIPTANGGMALYIVLYIRLLELEQVEPLSESLYLQPVLEGFS